MPDNTAAQDTGSEVTGKPGVAYDTEKLGEPGQPGVPTGDQYPANERDDNIEESGGGVGVDIPQKKDE